MAKPQRFYGVCSKHGYFFPDCIASRKRDAIEQFCNQGTGYPPLEWREWYAKGFRAARIIVTKDKP